MANVLIPDKKCIVCGGVNWYTQTSSGGMFCVACHKVRTTKYAVSHKQMLDKSQREYMERERNKLSAVYIRRLIYNMIRQEDGTKIKSIQISQEQIERYRKGLQIKRINGKLIKNEGNMETIIEDVQKVKKQKSEKQKAHNREYAKKYWEMKKAERQALIDASVLGNTPTPKAITTPGVKSPVATPAVKGELELLFDTIIEQRKQLKASLDKLTQFLGY